MAVEVLKRTIFAKNERAAKLNRARFDEHGVVAVNLMGGAGCGKTTLLERVIPVLTGAGLRVAVLEGDLATTKDADRIAKLNVPVIQLLTEGGCHLTPTLVEQGLLRLPLGEIDLLVIENVGNPICPANFELGEHFRIAVLSVTEGDDKPAKYPFLFRVADLVVLSKLDLLLLTDFSITHATRDIQILSPGKPILHAGAHDDGLTRELAEWFLDQARAGPKQTHPTESSASRRQPAPA